MKRKKHFARIAPLLNAILLVIAVGFSRPLPGQTRNEINQPRTMSIMGPNGKFGPTIETVLPAGRSGTPEILDLETGHRLLHPPFDQFDFRVDSIMAWIRSNGLDVSCNIWSTGAACVTYDMTIVAVDGKRWEEITEKQLLNNPALAPRHHSPRRMLVLGQNRPDIYMFRTGEGTLGTLQIVGLIQHGRGVKIRYKLIDPVRTISVAVPHSA